jgi:myo-inositol 2-dehydrogenase/D-chiro-inositol 1-dehydrogenase
MSKIRCGAIGVGRLGFLHAKNLAFYIPGAELVAITSRTRDTLQKVKNKLGEPNCYTDYKEMLAKENLDALCITSPTASHPEHILAGLEAGLHIFCDKPLASNFADSEKLVQKIQQKHSDKICMVGFMKRYEKSYLFVKEQIKKGNLGEPIFFRGYGVDPQSMSESSIAYAKDQSHGGIFFDFFVHDFDLSRWLVGSDWITESVQAFGDSYLYDVYKEIGDADTACCTAKFQNKAMGFYYCGRTAPHGYLVETEIIGTEAIFRIATSPVKNAVEILDKRGNVREEIQTFWDRFSDAYYCEMKEFIRCVQTKKQPQNTLEDALLAAKMSHLAKTSFEKNKF